MLKKKKSVCGGGMGARNAALIYHFPLISREWKLREIPKKTQSILREWKKHLSNLREQT